MLDSKDSPGERSPLLKDLADRAACGRLLEGHGLPPAAAERRALLFGQCAEALVARGAGESSHARAFFVPGRIEVLGKHTDYCGGRSLLAATEQGFAFVALAGSDARVEMVDARREDSAAFEVAPDLQPPPGQWSNYPMTVARRLARNFPAARQGGRVAFASDLPPSAGMSSSSAFLTGSFLALGSFNELGESEEYRSEVGDRESLAAYLACVENGADFGPWAGDAGVGTQGGSEDHTAILCAQPQTLSLYSFQPTRLLRRVQCPAGVVFAIAASGVVAEKTGAAREKYNRASRLARAAVAAWNERAGGDEPHLAAILARSPTTAQELRNVLRGAQGGEFSAEELTDRFEHFDVESGTIIAEAVRCLEREDLEGFGEWVDCSQERGARLLGNQVEETIFLASAARLQGAIAASAFGAGFGGSVWALVAEEESGAFLDAWRKSYQQAFPGPAAAAAFFTTPASEAAFEVAAPREGWQQFTQR